MRGRWLTTLGAVAGLMLAAAPAATASTPSAATATVNLTVNVVSAQANPGSVAAENAVDGTNYGSCAGLSTAGTATCTLSVPIHTQIVIVALPGSGERWKSWANWCSGAPGPVCFLFTGSKVKTATATFVPVGKAAVVSAQSPFTYGNPPDCALDNQVSVVGTGFPANTSATLSDDGAVVASGTTTASGGVSLSYVSSSSEPGIYRTLSVTAGTVTAHTDVSNTAIVCLAGGTGTGGMVSFLVGDSDDDAGSSITYTFGSNSPVVVTNDATGAGQTTTPSYPCPSGKVIPEKISATVGVGTKWKYSGTVRFTFTCP